MASKLTSSDVKVIGVRDDVNSPPHRTNYDNIKNKVNEVIDDLAAVSIGTTNAETTAARPYNTSLKERLDNSFNPLGNVVVDGLVASAQTIPDMTVQISSGEGVVEGITVSKTTTSNTGTITAPTNDRYDIVVINSDNTITVLTGNDSTDPILPAVASTQRPLAIITLASSTTTITSSELTDIRFDGYMANSDWYFNPQDAVDALSAGVINGYSTAWYGELDFAGKSNIYFNANGSTYYRPDDSSGCLTSVNTVSNETNQLRVQNIICNDNSKAGAASLVAIDYTDNAFFDGITTTANTSSSATNKEVDIQNSDDIEYKGLVTDQDELAVTTSSNYKISTSERENLDRVIETTSDLITTAGNFKTIDIADGTTDSTILLGPRSLFFLDGMRSNSWVDVTVWGGHFLCTGTATLEFTISNFSGSGSKDLTAYVDGVNSYSHLINNNGTRTGSFSWTYGQYLQIVLDVNSAGSHSWDMTMKFKNSDGRIIPLMYTLGKINTFYP